MTHQRRDPLDLGRAGWHYHSRLYLGQVTAVNAEAGTAEVYIMDLREVRPALIPLGALTYLGEAGGSSWMRYMPERGAIVVVGYGVRNQLFILSYASFGASDGRDVSVDQAALSGYRELTRLAARREGGLARWRTLKSGEFDFRSSGGAALFLGADGTAILEGRGTALRLDGQRQGLEFTSEGFAAFKGNGYDLRCGGVQRDAAVPTPPLALVDAPIAPNPASAPWPAEYHVLVGTLLPGPAPVPVVLGEVHIGDLRDAQGAPIFAATGFPARSRTRLLNKTGIDLPANELLISEVDVQGNVNIRHGAGATPNLGTTVAMPLAPLTASFKSATVTTTGPMTLAAGPPVAGLQLGSPAATQGVALGPPLIATLTQLNATLIELNAHVAAIASALDAYPATAPAGTAPIVPLLVGPQPSSVASRLAQVAGQLGAAAGTLYSNKVVSDG